jgi:hypothetical protein
LTLLPDVWQDAGAQIAGHVFLSSPAKGIVGNRQSL